MSHVIKDLAGDAPPRWVHYIVGGDVQRIEFPTVRTGSYLETSSRIGLMIYIEGGESTYRKHRQLAQSLAR